jgi:hypothetical protein
LPGPYRIVDTGDGLFRLEPSPEKDAPRPTSEERALADAITGRLRWVRDRPVDSAAVMPAYANGLREIAETGLAADTGRDASTATETFKTHYGALDASAPEAVTRAGSFRLVFDDQTKEIKIERVRGGTAPTEDQRNFIDELIRQERLIRALIQRGESDPTRRQEAMAKATTRLQWAGQLGLEGAESDVPLGRLALRGILADAMQESGQQVRAAYLWDLAKAYSLAAAGVLVVAILVYAVTHTPWLSWPQELVIPGLRLILLVIALCFLFFGAWLSAAARLEPDSAEVVASIFASTLNAGLRVVYVLGFGFLAILLLCKQVIVFSFGASGDNGFTSATVLGKLSGAVLTGGFLGLGEALLPQTVIQRSASLIAAMTAR